MKAILNKPLTGIKPVTDVLAVLGNSTKRILSAICMLAAVIGAWYAGFWPFVALISLITVIASYEYGKLLKKLTTQKFIWVAAYVPVCILPAASFIILYDANPMLVIWLWLVVGCSDSFAWGFGKAFGKTKLAPKISPGKTKVGAVAGLFGAAASSFVLSMFYPALFSSIYLVILDAVVISVLAQMGDLLESYFKRQAGVKDSGRIIPGHGGVLDRVDGFWLSAFGAAVMFSI